MFQHFSKYQSLGNDFILFDWFKKPEVFIEQVLRTPSWPETVRSLCNRHTGIGADGVLILRDNLERGCVQMLIFNADGTQAQICMNGLRCMAHCLVTSHRFPDAFTIATLTSEVACTVTHNAINREQLVITTKLSGAALGQQQTLTVGDKVITGVIADVGNPHFIISEPITLAWLAQHGNAIETHEIFPHKTNVEFVWPQPETSATYNVLVHERGCGITQACSSGAAAITWSLFCRKQHPQNERITLVMPGGTVTCWVDEDEAVNLQAAAHKVFDGILGQE